MPLEFQEKYCKKGNFIKADLIKFRDNFSDFKFHFSAFWENLNNWTPYVNQNELLLENFISPPTIFKSGWVCLIFISSLNYLCKTCQNLQLIFFNNLKRRHFSLEKPSIAKSFFFPNEKRSFYLNFKNPITTWKKGFEKIEVTRLSSLKYDIFFLIILDQKA